MAVKRIVITIAFGLLIISTQAQWDIRLTAGYGQMNLASQTHLDMTIQSDNYLTAGVQIDYYITERFGLGIGGDYYLVNPAFDVILSRYEHQYKGTDNWEVDPFPRDYEFTVRSNAPELLEQNRVAMIDIPISAVYSFPLFNNVFFTSRLGFKVGIPQESSYELIRSDLFTRIYFEEWDLEVFEVPAHGLYDSRTDWHPRGELNMNSVQSLFGGLGLDFPLSRIKLRVTGYFSAGLNDVIPQKESSLIYWRDTYNPVLSLAKKVTLRQIGVKLGIGLMSREEKKVKYRDRVTCPWEY